MTTFLHDIWHDLREKRLWPVAVALVLAVVAVPFVLAKGGESKQTDAPASAAGAPSTAFQSAVVKLTREQEERPTSLGEFDPRDPFEPKGGYRSEDAAGTTDLSGLAEGGKVEPTEAGGSSANSGGGGGTTGSTPARRRPALRTVVDITFQAGERERDIDRLRTNTMLPNEDDPVLIFLGVRGHGTRAVFLVDSTLTVGDGEGNCRPSRSQCGELELEAGERQEFTGANGTTYAVTIDQIRRVRRGATSAKSAKRSIARQSLDAAARRRAEKAAKEREATIAEFKKRLAVLIILARLRADAAGSSPEAAVR
jgi:hypothetical protein